MTRKFLTDQEINLNENDFLKTKIYADNLAKIIRNTETDKVFTIGLYGSWGSGKSSIIETAKKEFDQSKDKFITYDAWQYSNDSFRRMFLRCLSKELNYSEINLKKLFYENETSDIKIKNKLSPLKITLFVISFILIYFFIKTFFFEFEFKNNFEIITTLSLISTISILLLGFFNQFKTSVSKPYLFAPEQFEEQFINIIKNSFDDKKSFISSLKLWVKNSENKSENKSKNKLEKIIIIIDNIDRCNSDVAYQLLTDIKTFLGSQKFSIVFIIPVDDKALLKHFFSNRVNLIIHNDKEEFLRKIFNITLRIKPYNSTDMFAFTKNICIHHEVNLKNDTINIIGQEYSKNPRRVIQLINNLIVELNNYPLEFSIVNETIICCILIIREEYQVFYSQICENTSLLVNYIHDESAQDLNRFMRVAETEFKNINNEVLSMVLLNSSNHFNNVPFEVVDMINTYNFQKVTDYFNKNKVLDNDICNFLCHKVEEAYDNQLKHPLSMYIELVCVINEIILIPEIYLSRVFDKFKAKLESIFYNNNDIVHLIKLIEFEEENFYKYNLKDQLIDIIKININSSEQNFKEKWLKIFCELILNITDYETAISIKEEYDKNYKFLPNVAKLTNGQFDELVTKKFIKNRVTEVDNLDIKNEDCLSIKVIIIRSRNEERQFTLNTIFSKFNSNEFLKSDKESRFNFAIIFNNLIEFACEENIWYTGQYMDENLESIFNEIEFFDEKSNLNKIDFFKTYETEIERLAFFSTLLINYYTFTKNLSIIEQYIVKIDKYIPELVREKVIFLLNNKENIDFYFNQIVNVSNYDDDNLVKLKKYFLIQKDMDFTELNKKSIVKIIEDLIVYIEYEEYSLIIKEILEEVVRKSEDFDLIINAINKSFIYIKNYNHLDLFPQNLKQLLCNQIELISIENYLDEDFLKFAFEQDNEHLSNKLIEKIPSIVKSQSSFDNFLNIITSLILSNQKKNLSQKLILVIERLRKNIRYNPNMSSPMIRRIKENLALLDTLN